MASPGPAAPPAGAEASVIWLWAPSWQHFGKFERCAWKLAHLGSTIASQPTSKPASLQAACAAVLSKNLCWCDDAEGASIRGPASCIHGSVRTSDELPQWAAAQLKHFRIAEVAAADGVHAEHCNLRLCGGTELRVTYACYRAVVCIQLSPSLASFDPVPCAIGGPCKVEIVQLHYMHNLICVLSVGKLLLRIGSGAVCCGPRAAGCAASK